MSTSIETKPQLGSPSDHWPPMAHIERKSDGPLREGKLALCGAKLMGIPLDDAHKVCEECIEIARKELSR
jgi:hypothetical protein